MKAETLAGEQPQSYDLSDVQGWIPTGLPWLDAVTGGGMPRGRTIEIYGDPDMCKTSLALQLLRAVNGQGGWGKVDDYENSLTVQREAMFGLQDGITHKTKHPETLELGLKDTRITLTEIYRKRRRAPFVAITDTLAAALAHAERAKEDKDEDFVKQTKKKSGETKEEKAKVGMLAKPRTMHEAMRRLTRKAALARAILVFVNQTYESPDQYAGVVTQGGKALKYYSSLRLKMTKAGKTVHFGRELDYRTDGFWVRIQITKSKVCRPWQVIYVPFYYDTGFDPVESLLYALQTYKGPKVGKKQKNPVYADGGWRHIVRADGSVIRFQRDNWRRRLADDPTILEELKDAAYRLYAPDWWQQANSGG